MVGYLIVPHQSETRQLYGIPGYGPMSGGFPRQADVRANLCGSLGAFVLVGHLSVRVFVSWNRIVCVFLRRLFTILTLETMCRFIRQFCTNRVSPTPDKTIHYVTTAFGGEEKVMWIELLHIKQNC
jgi:hypothetical protein